MSSLIPFYNRITEPYPEPCPPSGETSLGFGEYSDDLHTFESPLVITLNLTQQITNNASTSIEDNVVTPFYDGNRLRLTRVNDSYILRVSFTGFSSDPMGVAVIILDDSLAGDGAGFTNKFTITGMVGTTDVANLPYTVSFPFYATEDMILHGGTILLKSVGSDISLHNIKFGIYKIHSGVSEPDNAWIDELGDPWIDEFVEPWTT